MVHPLRCRIRGYAVCKSWLAALKGWGFSRLSFTQTAKGLCNWVLLHQPATTAAVVESFRDHGLATAVLHSLSREVSGFRTATRVLLRSC